MLCLVGGRFDGTATQTEIIFLNWHLNAFSGQARDGPVLRAIINSNSI